jgi:hypothetical protein
MEYLKICLCLGLVIILTGFNYVIAEPALQRVEAPSKGVAAAWPIAKGRPRPRPPTGPTGRESPAPRLRPLIPPAATSDSMLLHIGPVNNNNLIGRHQDVEEHLTNDDTKNFERLE